MPKYLKFLVLLLLAGVILWWFGRSLDWVAVRRAIALADRVLILAAVALICFSYLARAFRWQALLQPLAPASIGALFAATTVGFGALFLLGRAGEVLRPAFLPLKDRRVGPGAAFITIGVERIYDLTAVGVLFAVNLLWFRPATFDAALLQRLRVAGLLMLGAVVLGLTALLVFRRNAGSIIARCETLIERAPFLLQRLGRLLTGLLSQLSRALSVLVSFRELAVTIGWTILIWGLVVVTYWLLLRAFGLPLGPAAAIFLLGWTLVGSLVPTPGGGAGAFHAITGAGLMSLGVAREESAAVAIVMHLVLFSPAAFFGLYYFLRSDVSVHQLRSLVFAGEGELQKTASPPKAKQESLKSAKVAES